LIDQNTARARTILRFNEEAPTDLLEKSLARLLGVIDFEINHVNGTIRVDYDPQKITFNEIQNIAKR